MSTDEQSYIRTPFTTWEWRPVKITRRPAAPSKTGGEAASSRPSPWDRRTPVTLTVKYRGGPEAWLEVRSRGRTLRFPGYWSVYDVMRVVWNEPG